MPAQEPTARSAGEPRYRLWLINPRAKYRHHTNNGELSRLFGRRKMSFPLSLPLVAALTPPRYEVRIIDDETDAVPDGSPDLVGITAMASNVDRGYDIADLFRARGVPVVMGGSYVSFMVEEALGHCSTVVVGEAEGTWDACLADFERGELRSIYRAERPADFRQRPAPRWDLVDTTQIMALTVETSRGCPFDCDFCLVHKLYGRRLRLRRIDDVVAELTSLPLKRVLFTDDNFTVNRARAKELLRAIRHLGLTWVCQSDINVADDEELLGLMAEAGCHQILIGLESLDQRSLAQVGKEQNSTRRYEEAIARIHRHGIQVLASFIVGFDADTPDWFDRILAFVEQNQLVYVMASILAVLPGTELHRQMDEAGRLFPIERSLRNGAFPSMHYYNFSQLDLMERYFDLLARLCSPDSICRRAAALFSTGHFKQPRSAGVLRREKASAFFKLVWRYLIRGSSAKRRLFRTLFRLGSDGVASMDSVVYLLMANEAQQQYLHEARAYLDEVRRLVRAVDQGPWAAHRRSSPQSSSSSSPTKSSSEKSSSNSSSSRP